MTKDVGNFDEKLVKRLAKILKETELTEIEYANDFHKIRVARNSNTEQFFSGNPFPNQTLHQKTDNDDNVAKKEVSEQKSEGLIKSPMVGNMYLSPAPGVQPFIKVGSKVNSGDTILIIEAMKVMNHIKAHKSGIIKEIFVKNTEPVEFDQDLVLIG